MPTLYRALGDNASVTSSASELGWASLRGGDWATARESFDDALATGETGEALEGLSWAAWWLDDGETVFAARERAYRRYRADGDSAAAARMATWLAADELDFHGAAAVASGWLQRARRLLEPLEPGPDHGWLAFHEGFVAHMGGDGARATELAVEAAELGRRFDVADLEMLGLGLQGAALVAMANVEDGMRCLDEATAAALEGEAEIPISSAWTCCFLVSACTSVLDYERAADWCDRIAAFAERYGSRYMLGFCRAEYGEVQLWRGRWAEAESLLSESIEAFARSRPPYAAGPLAGLAELRRRQGRPDEAAELLERAGGTRGAELCRARLALDADEPQQAAELLERLLRRHAGPADAPVLELLVRALVARGELDGAAAALTELRALRAADRDDAAEGVGRPRRGQAGGCTRRARARAAAARRRGRRLRAQRSAVRGRTGEDRARGDARGARTDRARRARVGRGGGRAAAARCRSGRPSCRRGHTA